MKNVFSICILMFIAFSSRSQSTFLIGGEAGGTTSFFKKENFDHYDHSIISATGGIFIDYFKLPTLGFRLEIKHTSIGLQSKGNHLANLALTNDQTSLTKFKFDYISIPIALRFNLLKLSRFQSNSSQVPSNAILNFGVAVSKLIDQSTTMRVSEANGDLAFVETADGDFIPQANLIAGFVGWSFHYPIGQKRKFNFTLSGNFQFGFKSITSDTFFPASTLKPRSFNAFVGMAYKLNNN